MFMFLPFFACQIDINNHQANKMAADASTSYRNVKPIKDSDSEIESDEDTPLWRQKQERYLRFVFFAVTILSIK